MKLYVNLLNLVCYNQAIYFDNICDAYIAKGCALANQVIKKIKLKYYEAL